MKKFNLIEIILLVCLCITPAFAKTQLSKDEINSEALKILSKMTLKEKIGQKLMLDFRYWCTAKPQDKACTQDFISINPTVKKIISQNHIGGIILFANNLKDIAQITTLNHEFQQTMSETNNFPLLIGTDQEGGIVSRLPRDVSVTFPGNMAITAAYLGDSKKNYSKEIGKTIAMDLKALGININFAPDVDVNINPLNPVIHVRSFSDDPKLVAQLGLQLSQAIQEEGIAATLKHFPGHGDTVMDSHISLPIANHNLEQAWQIDLYPFKEIIEKNSPDLVMTAHIQFPALDNKQIYAGKIGKEITIPATLSRKIQFDLLRNQLGYQGIIITDALDMGAIAENFDSTDATIKAFQAGNDIVLMPVSISQPEDIDKLENLTTDLESAILNGSISAKELDQSVLRIITLKIKLGLLQPNQTTLSQKIIHAQQIFSDKAQYQLESDVTNDAITLVQNNAQLLPIKLPPLARIHIIMPWLEQGAGIAAEITRLQKEYQLPKNLQISFIKIANMNLDNEKHAIDNADIVIVGNSTTKSLSPNFESLGLNKMSSCLQTHSASYSLLRGDKNDSDTYDCLFPERRELSDAQFAYQALQYAKKQGKKTIFISLLAPYDLPNYKEVSDVMLAGYDYYGYLSDGDHGYYRGPSMQALTRIIFGISRATGKLPINIPNPNDQANLIYVRGYGLSTAVQFL